MFLKPIMIEANDYLSLHSLWVWRADLCDLSFILEITKDGVLFSPFKPSSVHRMHYSYHFQFSVNSEMYKAALIFLK